MSFTIKLKGNCRYFYNARPLLQLLKNSKDQLERKTNIIISLICGIWKNGTDELIYRTEIETQMQRTNLWIPRGDEGWWDELGDWD